MDGWPPAQPKTPARSWGRTVWPARIGPNIGRAGKTANSPTSQTDMQRGASQPHRLIERAKRVPRTKTFQAGVRGPARTPDDQESGRVAGAMSSCPGDLADAP